MLRGSQRRRQERRFEYTLYPSPPFTITASITTPAATPAGVIVTLSSWPCPGWIVPVLGATAPDTFASLAEPSPEARPGSCPETPHPHKERHCPHENSATIRRRGAQLVGERHRRQEAVPGAEHPDPIETLDAVETVCVTEGASGRCHDLVDAGREASVALDDRAVRARDLDAHNARRRVPGARHLHRRLGRIVRLVGGDRLASSLRTCVRLRRLRTVVRCSPSPMARLRLPLEWASRRIA